MDVAQIIKLGRSKDLSRIEEISPSFFPLQKKQVSKKIDKDKESEECKHTCKDKGTCKHSCCKNISSDENSENSVNVPKELVSGSGNLTINLFVSILSPLIIFFQVPYLRVLL